MNELKVERHGGGRSFLESAGDLLLAAEVENNLILGLAPNIESAADTDAYLGVVVSGGTAVAAAVRTPPHRVVVTSAEPAHLRALASDVADFHGAVPGVLGPIDAAHAFPSAWTGVPEPATPTMDMRIHQIERVLAPSPMASGRMRVVEPADLEIFMDLTNPTSNHIYQAIGYEPVCNVVALDFVSGEGG